MSDKPGKMSDKMVFTPADGLASMKRMKDCALRFVFGFQVNGFKWGNTKIGSSKGRTPPDHFT
jgi:hypothetical protein